MLNWHQQDKIKITQLARFSGQLFKFGKNKVTEPVSLLLTIHITQEVWIDPFIPEAAPIDKHDCLALDREKLRIQD